MPATTIISPGQEVEVPAIASALRELWGTDAARTKAALTNFAIYSEDPGSLEANTALMSEVTAEHACRAILIAARPDEGETTVRTWVTAHCQLSGTGGKQVCSEQISFLLTGRIRNLLRNIVFSSLESDLPLVFFWQGSLTRRFEPHLFRRIDRLVVDSASWSDPVADFDAIREAVRDTNSHFVILDLGWMCIFPFRQALAGAFDEACARAQLASLDTLSITHAPGRHLTALYLVSWIAYKTGWFFQSETELVRPDGSIVKVALTESASQTPLSRLRFTGPGSDIDITRDPAASFLHTRLTVPGLENTQVTPACPDSGARLLIERLSRGGNNALYFKLWKPVRRLLGKKREGVPAAGESTVPAAQAATYSN